MIIHVPVVGIDPSLTATGLATPVGLHVVGSEPDQLDIRGRHKRLAEMAGTIALMVAEDVYPRYALCVIEQPAYSKTNYQHERSGLWWMVVDHLLDAGHAVCEVSPSARAKYATGNGKAAKDKVLAAVVRRYPDQDVRDNNTADALILRAMGCRFLGDPLEDGLPIAHKAAMENVLWPAALAPEAAA